MNNQTKEKKSMVVPTSRVLSDAFLPIDQLKIFKSIYHNENNGMRNDGQDQCLILNNAPSHKNQNYSNMIAAPV